MWAPMWAHWHHLANMIELGFLRPTRVHNPNGKSIGSAVYACTAHGRVSSGVSAPPCEYDRNCAHWRHLAITIELVLLLAHPSPQPKRQINRFSCFCAAHGNAWATHSPKIALSHGGSGPHLIHDSLGYSEIIMQTA